MSPPSTNNGVDVALLDRPVVLDDNIHQRFRILSL